MFPRPRNRLRSRSCPVSKPKSARRDTSSASWRAQSELPPPFLECQDGELTLRARPLHRDCLYRRITSATSSEEAETSAAVNQRRQERFAQWLHLQLYPEEEEEAVAADAAAAAAEQEGMEEERAADVQPDAPAVVDGPAPTAGAEEVQEGANAVVDDDVAMQED